jgi:hypothetical protein
VLTKNSWAREFELLQGSGLTFYYVWNTSLSHYRVIGTKPDSSFIWIEDNGSVALADVSAVLASDNSTVDLFCQPKCHIMVTGYVEELEVGLPFQ